jgi:hypothetical protein
MGANLTATRHMPDDLCLYRRNNALTKAPPQCDSKIGVDRHMRTGLHGDAIVGPDSQGEEIESAFGVRQVVVLGTTRGQ